MNLPTLVILDGASKPEGTGWTYDAAQKVVTISGATASAKIKATEASGPAPSYKYLTMTAATGGSTDPASPGVYSYVTGASVICTASEGANYNFTNWLLDSVDVGSANPYTVTMNANHTMQAVFEYIPPEEQLNASINYLDIPCRQREGVVLNVRRDITTYLGQVYIDTSTDMRIQEYFHSDWLNYTVANSGTQVIDGGFARPNATYINGLLKASGYGWTYADGRLTVTGATSSAAFFWGAPIIPTPSTGIGNYTWYMRSDTVTTNDVLGYRLNETKSASVRAVSENIAGNVTAYYGIRVWIYHNDNSSTELTGGEPQIIANRSSNGYGYQNGSWNCPKTALALGQDSVVVRLYMRPTGSSSSWENKATFTSHRLMKTWITETAWVFRIYTLRQYSAFGNTLASMSWGDDSHLSLIANIGLVDPSVFEMMLYNLANGDFFNFITLPYTFYIGNIFYGLFLLVPCATLYMRYRTVMPVLLIFIIFGGAGGFITLAFPVAGLQIGWVFLLFGLAGLLYKVFR